MFQQYQPFQLAVEPLERLPRSVLQSTMIMTNRSFREAVSILKEHGQTLKQQLQKIVEEERGDADARVASVRKHVRASMEEKIAAAKGMLRKKHARKYKNLQTKYKKSQKKLLAKYKKLQKKYNKLQKKRM